MPETKKTCQVKMHDGKPCGRELHDEEFCIFHSKKKDKELNLFNAEFYQLYRDKSVRTLDFTSFIFPQNFVFPRHFSKPVSFLRAIFQGESKFPSTVFKQRTSFIVATFKEEANFGGAVFESEVQFGSAVFEKTGYFAGTNFKDRAFFGWAKFRGITTFLHAKFESIANFYGTTFESQTEFEGVVFKGGTYFMGSRFRSKVNFSGVKFEDILLIDAENLNVTAFRAEVDFRFVKFFNPQNIEFRKVDLSKFRFLETDVCKVRFTDVKWNKYKGKGRNRVFDEVSPHPLTGFDHALIAQLYRRLRANYEENLRYSEAGDFYIGEMEMTRKAQTSIFKKLPLLFYKAISNYGESYYRPLGWIAAILLIFPLLFIFAGIQPVGLDPNNPIQDVINYRLDFSSIDSFLPSAEKISHCYTSFLYSMSVFSFIRDKKYTTIDNWGHTLFVLESILSPVTLAFFLLALRRRFKR